MKNFISEVWPYLLGMMIGLGLVAGFVFLLTSKLEREEKQANISCAKIAELGGIKEYKLSKDNRTCYMVLDGKLAEVTNW